MSSLSCCGKNEFRLMFLKPYSDGTLELPVFECKICNRHTFSEALKESIHIRWAKTDTYEGIANRTLRVGGCF